MVDAPSSRSGLNASKLTRHDSQKQGQGRSQDLLTLLQESSFTVGADGGVSVGPRNNSTFPVVSQARPNRPNQSNLPSIMRTSHEGNVRNPLLAEAKHLTTDEIFSSLSEFLEQALRNQSSLSVFQSNHDGRDGDGDNDDDDDDSSVDSLNYYRRKGLLTRSK